MASRGSATPNLWRHSNFMKLWAGQTVSQFGAQITLVAFPLTAVVVLHATALQMGVLEALAMAPFLVVGLPVGVWVDRLARRPLLIGADVTRLAVIGLVPVLYVTHHLTSMAVLDAVQFVAGCMTVLFDVAYQSYLPAVVGTDALIDGNSRLEASRAVSQVAGPSLGGALATAFTAPMALFGNAFTYLVSVVSLLSMRTEEARPVRQPGRSMRREMADGLRLVLKNPVLASIAGCTATSNFFSSIALAVYVLYAVHRLHLTQADVGLLYGLGSVGGIAAAFLAGRAAQRFGLGRALLLSTAIGAVGQVLVPMAPQTAVAFFLLVAALALGGFGGTVYNINQVSLRQAITARELLGRMNASMRFIVWGSMPLGSLAGGALGAAIGLHGTLWVAALGGLVAPLWMLRRPVQRLTGVADAVQAYGGAAAASPSS